MNADQLIRHAHGRVTPTRTRVLTTLLDAERALTHLEVAERLAPAVALDRVTLYRTLDWLVEQALAHRVAGEDRTWRFNASPGGAPAHHAHFNCTRCGQIFCIEALTPALALQLPPDFHAQQIELSIKGLCAGCNPA